MSFTSLQFLGFLPIVVSLYFIVPQRFRWLILLISSYYFYIAGLAINSFYMIILILVTVLSYLLAKIIYKTESKKKKKFILLIGSIIFLGSLLFFKYLNFFNENIRDFLNIFKISANIPSIKLIVPLGISFYTFQIVSYLIDVYNEKTEPIRHFGVYAAGVSFFPKLISGPIERSPGFYKQLIIRNEIEYNRIIDGVKLFIWGLFKKVVIADRIAYAVNLVFDHPENYHGFSILFAVIMFTIQIYADFSGYTDMAIGISRIFGIKLSENFDRPYLSGSITEFWRKWHITLSFWLRDYVFLPLAYSFTRKIMKSRLKIKPEVLSYVAAMLITMFICGLWHGAKWTFIFWGLIHGIYLAIGFLLKKPRKKLYKKINLNKTLMKYSGIFICFILVSFAWMFFRLNAMTDFGVMMKNIFDFGNSVSFLKLFDKNADFYVSIISIFIIFVVEFVQTHKEKNGEDFSLIKILNIPFVFILLLSIFVFGKFEQLDFLYFNF